MRYKSYCLGYIFAIFLHSLSTRRLYLGHDVNGIDAAQEGTDPNTNPYCGKKIHATRLQEGETQNSTIDVTVVDRCVGCGVYDLDFSPTAFSMLANETLGRVDVSWWFLD